MPQQQQHGRNHVVPFPVTDLREETNKPRKPLSLSPRYTSRKRRVTQREHDKNSFQRFHHHPGYTMAGRCRIDFLPPPNRRLQLPHLFTLYACIRIS